MNHAARRIGRSLALVLPVVLVLSGTLAVTRVPWAASPSDTQLLTASSHEASSRDASTPASPPASSTGREPQDALRDRLIAELQEQDPGVALSSLQRAMTRKPSLARHCTSLARALGKAAVHKYGAQRAQRFSRPVCDTSFAYGVAQMG
ncbi:hypothetical protein MMF93_15110 [Streptomyces tubbatahanensis]|uniref:Secreted protein n=1 Tax=Streptomyces tubbatahanensis TaxID=2923272 RepID=A0ABY3XTD7_9ACTN|nr:hypothetical protein [Streptomyces tubbatahanensis]UNS97667.1 hypothetical protein MMF93_15110 [Streptomyces tubbatahanensis]